MSRAAAARRRAERELDGQRDDADVQPGDGEDVRQPGGGESVAQLGREVVPIGDEQRAHERRVAPKVRSIARPAALPPSAEQASGPT